MLFRRKRSAIQQCPICGAKHTLDVVRCTQCGAALSGVPVGLTDQVPPPPKRKHILGARLIGPPTLEWHEGESDLHEAELPAFSWSVFLIGTSVFLLVVGIVIFAAVLIIRPQPQPLSTADVETAVAIAPSDQPTSRSTAPPTNTRNVLIPTPSLATVTPMPSTPTITPTRGPCIQKVKAGDTLSGLAARCGHHDRAIIQVILDLNNIADANQLQVGQTVEIPWPTPTGGAPAPVNGATDSAGGPVNNEPTLPPGVMWYTVKKGDDAISIAVRYHMTMKSLRDFNLDILKFQTCDFSLPSGGASCVVQLVEGQRIRVQAPTPTPTLSPTFSGSETATPSATATFNAPFSQSPDDNMPFAATELPVLRWVASGELGPTEVYLVRVRDVDLNVTYTMTTRDLSFQLPPEWGPTDGKRHTFEWSVSVASLNASRTPIPSTLSTEIRTFTWQSR